MGRGLTLRYAWRSLAKSPGFVAIAVIALGVGLGLSTTMLAVLDAVLHPYVAYRNPETLYSVNWWFGRRNPMQPAELYRYIRDNNYVFSDVVPMERYARLTLRVAGVEEEVSGVRVSPRFFPVTGVEVERGRVFRAGDGEDVAIVSAQLWRRLNGRRSDLRGATITLGVRTYLIVGVMPAAAGGGVWLPIAPNIETDAVRSGFVRPLVRLRAGVSRDEADAEMKRLAQLLTDRFAARDAPFAFELYPQVRAREEIRDIQKAMVGAALAVLLIACVNLAHLMLARGLAKRRELALRMALGASRATVVRQMFAECAMITALGTALGVAVALWGAYYLRNQMPPEVRWIGLVRPELSWRVFAMTAVAAAASAVLFGLIPAIKVALAVDLDDPLKDDAGTTTGRHRQRYSPLVISEVGLALVLMMGGGLLLRTVYLLQREDDNLNTRTLYSVWTYPRRGLDSAAAAQAMNDVLVTVRGTEGVASVALSRTARPVGGSMTGEMEDDSSRVILWAAGGGYQVVTPDYLRVLGLPILRGRNFEPGDVAAPVAILDAIAADRLYPRQDPVGRMVKLGAPRSNAPWVRVIGVVRSPRVLESRDRGAPQPSVFVAGAMEGRGASIAIRTRSEDPRVPARLQARLRNAAGVGGSWVMAWDYERRNELVSRAFLARIFVGMGAVALGLAALGLYGVLAYAVSRRMREFAVRLALGAEPGNLLRMVFHDGAVMLLAGTGLGAFAALAAARYLDAVLVAVLPSDVVALVLSEAVLLAVGFAAATVPARRAASANPLDIIRAV